MGHHRGFALRALQRQVHTEMGAGPLALDELHAAAMRLDALGDHAEPDAGASYRTAL